MLTHLFFDLDGTLTDPGEGITNSVAYALERFGIHVEDRRVLYPFIGPPLADAFRDQYGFSPGQAQQAIRYYREYFPAKGIFENEVYPGIPETLQALRGEGLTLCLATSKPEEFARRILEHFNLAQYFDTVTGASLDGKLSRKADVLKAAMDRAGLFDPRQALMVGDRRHDVEGAAENGMDTVGAVYGYGSREELTEAGAKYLIDRPEELIELAKKRK